MRPSSAAAFFDEDRRLDSRTASSTRPNVQLESRNDFLPRYAAVDFAGASAFKKDKLNEKILEFSQYNENWDGEGALRISDEAKETALNLIEELVDALSGPEIRATGNGTLEFIWTLGSTEALLEIGKSTFSLYCDRGKVPPLLCDGSTGAGISQILTLLKVGLNLTPTHPLAVRS